MLWAHKFVTAPDPNHQGPIIRINPHEIHMNDPEYIDEVYAGSSKKRDKYRWITRATSKYGNRIF